jgi:predicted dehydrogenase
MAASEGVSLDMPVNIILSGPGLIGRKHAALIKAQPACVLAGIVAPTLPENVLFASEMGVPLWSTLQEALAEGRADAAIISSPNSAHFEQATLCLERRMPVLVEKPVTDNLADALALVKQSDSSGVPVLVGHHRTYSPLLDVADQFLGSVSFGKMVAMQGAAMFYKPAHYFVEGAWRTRKGGGPILINLIHEIGLMRHFCGEIRTVFAMASNVIRGFEVEDSVAISLRFDSGALGTFLLTDTGASSKSWEMTSGENPAYPSFPDEDCYHFAGTRGSLDFPSMRVRHYADGVDPSWWRPFDLARLRVQRADPLARQLDHFVEVVQGRCPPRVSARDGYMNMLVVDAIARSIERQAMVDVHALIEEGAV